MISIKKTGQRVSPMALPAPKPQASILHVAAGFKLHRMSARERQEVREWIRGTARAARTAEKAGMQRSTVIGILIHAHP